MQTVRDAAAVAEIAGAPKHADRVADAARMHALFEHYRAMPVETHSDDAGTLEEAGKDVGAYVRDRVAQERTRAQPPWFFPTHLRTCVACLLVGHGSFPLISAYISLSHVKLWFHLN
jgi:hypothetical protein